MEVKILVFGNLVDIIGSDCIYVEDIHDTHALSSFLLQKYPAIKGREFVISLDRKIVSSISPLSSNAEVALLPPFSGG